jgi:hypothetical protein
VDSTSSSPFLDGLLSLERVTLTTSDLRNGMSAESLEDVLNFWESLTTTWVRLISYPSMSAPDLFSLPLSPSLPPS